MSVDNDEEDDYIAEKDDIRPGLVPKSVARLYKQDAKKKEVDIKNRTKPRHVMEKEEREKALNKTLSSNNKGFSLLSKMGYKPGMSIGKDGKGRLEPVPISLKSNRTGLGHDTEIKRKTDKTNQLRSIIDEKRIKLEERSRENFRSHQSKLLRDKKTMGYVRKSQKVCEQLDSNMQITQPHKSFFWPKLSEDQGNEAEDNDEAEEEEDLPEPEEQLADLTDYLRNDDDMLENCPGNTAEDHDE
ncbi:DgyrCDS5494 [Dimorphilus gyrociliatus]|uniref:G patch domain-containing protein 11 n=1 Tax=Dimorphilus gyrociliatus TaxID=2664684 RepID=A0A7I8VPV1_9ANNE|nr:DgyrCDS5494 [Dimorphilus gyrociliatus]